MKTLPIGLLYLSLHNQLKKRVGINGFISKREMFIKLGKHFLIPKNLRVLVIKEMEERKLIKVEGDGRIQVLRYGVDFEKESGKFFMEMGIY